MAKYIAILLILITNEVAGQNFDKEIDEIYDFVPHKMTKAQKEEKMALLDGLFTKIIADTTKYLPLLREALKSDKHNPYFYFDCSHLLMETSPKMADWEISAAGFAKSDIKDLDHRTYVTLLNRLARNDINVTKAALKMLEDSTFSFFLPAHSFTYSQGYCLAYCLLPLDPEQYTDTLMNAFKDTKSIQAQKSIITTIWFSATCMGDNFLKRIGDDNTLSEGVAKYAREILKNTEIEDDYKSIQENMSETDIGNMRKIALKRFSDEAIMELDFTTKIKRKKLTCK